MAETLAPFLEVVTRCYKRPAMLAANVASLQAQTCDRWKQTLLVDDVGRGVAWANGNLAGFVPTGHYVWLLDDDDLCIRETLVAELFEIVPWFNPDVIMLRMDHGELGVLPDDGIWGQGPALGRIGNAAYVVRREIWLNHAAAWERATYDGDFYFIEAIFRDAPRVYWHDVIASRVQRISRGRAEDRSGGVAMKGEVLVSFVGMANGVKVRPQVGQVIEIPPNVDWVQAGFVRPIEEPKKKKAATKAAVENTGEESEENPAGA